MSSKFKKNIISIFFIIILIISNVISDILIISKSANAGVSHNNTVYLYEKGNYKVEIFDDSYYTHNEPDIKQYTIQINEKNYISYSAEQFKVDEKINYLIVELKNKSSIIIDLNP